MTSVLTLPSHMSGFLHELGSHSGVYSYVSKPTMLVTNKPKFRTQINGKAPNIMIDKRVVRGNTYSSPLRTQIFNIGSKQKVTPTDGTFIRRRENNNNNTKTIFNQKKKGPDKTGKTLPDIMDRYPSSPKHMPSRYSYMNGGPPSKVLQTINSHKLPNGIPGAVYTSPVPGRKHSSLQTEKWLEELPDKAPEAHVEVQTDPYKTPESSPRRPLEAGLDKATQIDRNDPHLHNFDEEVGVLLEAVIGRTLEQSLLEVLEEEETAILRNEKLEHMARVKALSVA